MSMQGFAHSLIALRGEVKVIIHVLVGDTAVGVDEAWVYVEEGGVGKGRHSLLDEFVYLCVSLSQGVW